MSTLKGRRPRDSVKDVWESLGIRRLVDDIRGAAVRWWARTKASFYHPLRPVFLRLLTQVILLISLFAFGCSAGPAAITDSFPTPTATSQPPPLQMATPTSSAVAMSTPEPPPKLASTVPAQLHPPNARTGVAEIDTVLDAVATRNASILRGLMKFSAFPCSDEPVAFPKGPACRGEPEGAPVFAFRTSRGCTPGYSLDQAEEANRIERGLLGQQSPVYPYAAFQGGDATVPEGLPVAYTIVFAQSMDDTRAQAIFLDAQGAIIGQVSGCAAADARVRHVPTFILPPLGP